MNDTKNKKLAIECAENGMLGCVKYAATAQYANEKGEVQWSTMAAEILDKIGHKERSAGAEALARQMEAARAAETAARATGGSAGPIPRAGADMDNP